MKKVNKLKVEIDYWNTFLGTIIDTKELTAINDESLYRETGIVWLGLR